MCYEISLNGEKQKMKTVLITGRSLGQGLGIELGKYSKRYYNSVTTCEMNSKDMEELGVKPGDIIRISTDFGAVVARAVESLQEIPSGMVFIPYGPWINTIVDPETHGTGMPSFKGISANVEAIPGEKVVELSELIKK